jgi:hypothetical protein
MGSTLVTGCYNPCIISGYLPGSLLECTTLKFLSPPENDEPAAMMPRFAKRPSIAAHVD